MDCGGAEDKGTGSELIFFFSNFFQKRMVRWLPWSTPFRPSARPPLFHGAIAIVASWHLLAWPRATCNQATGRSERYRGSCRGYRVGSGAHTPLLSKSPRSLTRVCLSPLELPSLRSLRSLRHYIPCSFTRCIMRTKYRRGHTVPLVPTGPGPQIADIPGVEIDIVHWCKLGLPNQ